MNCWPSGSRSPRRNTLSPSVLFAWFHLWKRTVVCRPRDKPSFCLPLFFLCLSLSLPGCSSSSFFHDASSSSSLCTSYLDSKSPNIFRLLSRLQQTSEALLCFYPCPICFVLTKASPLNPNNGWPVCLHPHLTLKVLTVGKLLHHAALFANMNSWFQNLEFQLWPSYSPWRSPSQCHSARFLIPFVF